MPADHEAQSQVKSRGNSCRREEGSAKFTIVGTPACKRETRVTSTREGKYRAKVTREAHVAAENRETQGSRTTLWQNITESSSESVDQVVVNYRTGAGPATSTTQQCWSDHQQQRRNKLPQDGAGGADQTRTMTTRKSQSSEKKPTSSETRVGPKPRIGTKEKKKSAEKRDTASVSQEVSRRTWIRRT